MVSPNVQVNTLDPHVFISYVREDKSIVDELYSELISRGVNVWLDRKNIEPGMRWKIAIRKAIEKGAFFFACFSSSSINKLRSHMNEELIIAIEEIRIRQNNAKWFIPIRLDECDIPDLEIYSGVTINSFQRVDLFQDWDAGIFSLLDTISANPKNTQAMSNYTEHYKLSFHDEPGFVKVHRTTQYEPINLTTKPVVFQPGFYDENSGKDKYIDIILDIYNGTEGNWTNVHHEHGKLVDNPNDYTVRFQSSIGFELNPMTLRTGHNYMVQQTKIMAMKSLDRDIIASLRPASNVKITCESVDNSFVFSIGDSPDLIEVEPGREWVLQKELPARENLNVRWKPK